MPSPPCCVRARACVPAHGPSPRPPQARSCSRATRGCSAARRCSASTSRPCQWVDPGGAGATRTVTSVRGVKAPSPYAPHHSLPAGPSGAPSRYLLVVGEGAQPLRAASVVSTSHLQVRLVHHARAPARAARAGARGRGLVAMDLRRPDRWAAQLGGQHLVARGGALRTDGRRRSGG